MTRAAVLIAFGLSGCSGAWSFGPPPAPPPAVAPGQPSRIVVENGQAIQEPLTPIESTIEGLSQAQTVRVLVKQLSRP